MAAPVIKIKRSSVPGKIPTTASLPLGELALNTNDGKVYIQQDSVGIGSTVIVVNPWSVGLGSNTYNTFFTVGSVGIGTTVPTSSLHVVGNGKFTGVVTATTFVGALTGTATSTTNIPNLTGAITSNNTTTSLGSFSSANLATALTDETGSGAAVFATSPTLVTPVLGAATATSIVVGSGVTINASGINVTGVITATSGFSGNASSATYAINAGVSTSVIGGIGSITQLQVTGVSTFTNGPILVGTATSTGTALQRLQVTGGAYVSGSLGIGTTNPSDKLHTLGGNIRVDSATGAVNFWSGAGFYGGIGVAGGLGGSGTDIVIRADTTRSIVFFTGGINDRGRIDSNGIFLVGTATSTGTASQPLQVTGGAYVSGSVGIGTTNPTSKLHVVGDVRVTGIVTASAFSGDGSALTGITASGVVSVQISESAPGSPSVGDLWYNSSVGRIFIYYADDNSDQWVDAAPFNNGGGDGSVVISPLAPEGSVDGSLWFSTISARLFIYYNDGDSSQWVDAAPFNSASASVLEFPTGDYEDLSTSTIDAFNQNIGDISYDCLSYPLASLVEYDLGTI